MAEPHRTDGSGGERRQGTWRLSTPLQFGGVTMQTVERVTLHHVDAPHAQPWCMAAITPFALLVQDSGGLRALSIDGADLSMAELRLRWPEIDAQLAAMTPQP